MNLQDVLQSMNSGQTKEASAQERDVPNLEEALRGSLEKTAGQVKQANEEVDILSEILAKAEALAGMDKEAELRLSEMMGNAFADAAISRFAAYDAHVKQAAYVGDPQYVQQMEKTAEEQYVEGFIEGVEQVKLASADEFAKGAYETRILISNIRNG
jgi:hypothetical protein